MLISYSTYQPEQYNKTVYSVSASNGGHDSTNTYSYSTSEAGTQDDFNATVEGQSVHTYTGTFIFQSTTNTTLTINTSTVSTAYSISYISSVSHDTDVTSLTIPTYTTKNYTNNSCHQITTKTINGITTITFTQTYTQDKFALTATMVTVFRDDLLFTISDFPDDGISAPLEIYESATRATLKPDAFGVIVTNYVVTKVEGNNDTSNTNPTSESTYTEYSTSVSDVLTYHILTQVYTTMTEYEPVLFPPITRTYVIHRASYVTTTISQTVSGVNTDEETFIIEYGLSDTYTSAYTSNITTEITVFNSVSINQFYITAFSSNVITTTTTSSESFERTSQKDYIVTFPAYNENQNATLTLASTGASGSPVTYTYSNGGQPSSSSSWTIGITASSTNSFQTTTQIYILVDTYTTRTFTMVQYTVDGFNGTIETTSTTSYLLDSKYTTSIGWTTSSTTNEDGTSTSSSSDSQESSPAGSGTAESFAYEVGTYSSVIDKGASGAGDEGRSITHVSYKRFDAQIQFNNLSIWYPIIGFGMQQYSNTAHYESLIAASTLPYPFYATAHFGNVLTPILYSTTLTVFYANEGGEDNGYSYYIAPSGNIVSFTYEHQDDTNDTGTNTVSLVGAGYVNNTNLFINNTDSIAGAICGTTNKTVYIFKPVGIYRTISDNITHRETITEMTSITMEGSLSNFAIEAIPFYSIATSISQDPPSMGDLIISSTNPFWQDYFVTD